MLSPLKIPKHLIDLCFPFPGARTDFSHQLLTNRNHQNLLFVKLGLLSGWYESDPLPTILNSSIQFILSVITLLKTSLLSVPLLLKYFQIKKKISRIYSQLTFL